MTTRLIKSSYFNNLQPSIKEELLGISGLLIQIFQKFGRDAKSQRTLRCLTCNDTFPKVLGVLTLFNDIQLPAMSLMPVLGEAKEWLILHSINTKLKEVTIY